MKKLKSRLTEELLKEAEKAQKEYLTTRDPLHRGRHLAYNEAAMMSQRFFDAMDAELDKMLEQSLLKTKTPKEH